jgi:hypothetical protein
MLTVPVHAAETRKLSEVSHLHGIAVDPTDPARLYLASHHGVWLTNPDGTATRVSDNRHDYMGFTPNPTQPGAFYASGHPETGGNLGVLVSTDGAKTWKQVSAGVSGPVDFHSMDASPADPNVLYGHYGSVQVSRLEGQPDWQSRKPDGRMPAPPHDASGHTWHHPDDVLFEITRNGISAFAPPAYESDMPAFGDLGDAEIRAVLAFIKSSWPEDIRHRHAAMSERAKK